MKRLKQFRLEGIIIDDNSDIQGELRAGSYPTNLASWTSGNMNSEIGNDVYAYSLQVYGKPGTQFWINSAINPIELGPSGYYALELHDYASISRLEFDENNLKTLYSTNDSMFIPLVIDIKTKTIAKI